jgi:hypothetical protein
MLKKVFLGRWVTLLFAPKKRLTSEKTGFFSLAKKIYFVSFWKIDVASIFSRFLGAFFLDFMSLMLFLICTLNLFVTGDALVTRSSG